MRDTAGPSATPSLIDALPVTGATSASANRSKGIFGLPSGRARAAESSAAGASMAEVARRHDVNPNLPFTCGDRLRRTPSLRCSQHSGQRSFITVTARSHTKV